MHDEPPISLAFDLIRRYAVRAGWVPVGWRVFTVGPWTVTVNGTETMRDRIPPYHALIEHRNLVALLLSNPYGGWRDAEATFISDMEAALSQETEATTDVASR